MSIVFLPGGGGGGADVDTLVRTFDFEGDDGSINVIARWRNGKLDLTFQTDYAAGAAVGVLPVGWRPDTEIRGLYYDANADALKQLVVGVDGNLALGFSSVPDSNFGLLTVDFYGVNSTKATPTLPYPGTNIPF